MGRHKRTYLDDEVPRKHTHTNQVSVLYKREKSRVILFAKPVDDLVFAREGTLWIQNAVVAW